MTLEVGKTYSLELTDGRECSIHVSSCTKDYIHGVDLMDEIEGLEFQSRWLVYQRDILTAKEINDGSY